MADDAVRAALARLARREDLSEQEAEAAFGEILEGAADEAAIGAFLMGLRVKGETIGEITAAARVLRARMIAVEAPPGAMDCCGTGGTGRNTFNVSTAVAFVLAGGGIPVAKHGNRGRTRSCGSADVLEALGVTITGDAALIAREIREAGIGFMMAPLHHGAMKTVAGARRSLGTRTIFNLLGPLINPAGVTRQLVGVSSEDLLGPMAEGLSALRTERAWVVHSEGFDELTTLGPSHIVEVRAEHTRRFKVSPDEAGLKPAALDDLIGGDAQTNAAALKAVLAGESGAYRDIVVLNAAACFIISGHAESLMDGADLAAKTIDSGRAKAALDRLVAISNADAGA